MSKQVTAKHIFESKLCECPMTMQPCIYCIKQIRFYCVVTGRRKNFPCLCFKDKAKKKIEQNNNITEVSLYD